MLCPYLIPYQLRIFPKVDTTHSLVTCKYRLTPKPTAAQYDYQLAAGFYRYLPK